MIPSLRYCKTCLDANPTLSITLKAPTRKSFRKRTQRDYANMNSGLQSDPKRWLRMLENKPIRDAPFKRLDGGDVCLQWLEEDDNAMTEPIVIEKPEGLGMKMPSSGFTVDDVTEIIGEGMPIEVIGKSQVIRREHTLTEFKMSLRSQRRLGGRWASGMNILIWSLQHGRRYVMSYPWRFLAPSYPT